MRSAAMLAQLVACSLVLVFRAEVAKRTCASYFADPPSDCLTQRSDAHTLPHLQPAANVFVLLVAHRGAVLAEGRTANESAWAISLLLDRFMQTRPQWVIREEQPTHAVLLRVSDVRTHDALLVIASAQYPQTCADRRLVVRSYVFGFSEYGNEHFNLQATHSAALGAVFDVFAPSLPHTKGVAFADPGTCPLEANKWRCAFMPATNCSWPAAALECVRAECYGQTLYSQASESGVIADMSTLSALSSDPLRRQLESLQRRIEGVVVQWTVAGDFSSVRRRSQLADWTASKLFALGLLSRPRAEFRLRVAQQVARFNRLHPPLASAGCVAVHVRHHDRGEPGRDVQRFCREFLRHPNETCSNATTGAVIPHCAAGLDLDYGCDSAIPFAAITFDMYVRAARTLVEDTPGQRMTLFVITDDGAWVRREARATRGSVNVHVMPAPADHRTPSSASGANVFASLQLAQQCSALVAHSGSAFARLIRDHMCFRHRALGKTRFGACPPMFDFRALAPL